MPDDRFRLPRTAIPVRYDLTLEPDLKATTFSGFEDVTLDVAEATDTLVLNALELQISSGQVTAPDGSTISVTGVDMDAQLQRATLTLDRQIQPGQALLHLEFNGVLNDKLVGFYRSTYQDAATGETHVIATTQFESTDARLAFPCWDEPEFKAVFGVTLVVDEGLLALSNGAEIGRETRDDGKQVVRFADTMKQSTYLLAFIVGRLDITDPVDADGIPLRVAYVPGKGHLVDFALECGRFSLKFFNDYYGIRYPGGKMDMIALPDFAFGAMENTGCVTYRESLLLVDRANATQPELEDIADVVAHELAHQWFGNLVTMRWWNGIWLNEAFATFMALLVVEAQKPEWRRFASFLQEASAAKEVDSLHSTRPIEFPVVSPDDAQGMFDILTYQKGGAILRMLEQYLGPERFRDGIRLYLKRHEYGSTETHDLWDALEEATGEPVRRIMDGWIWQGGYPLISVTPDDEGVRLDQRQFLADGTQGDQSWDVPMRVRQLEGGAESSVLVGAEGLSHASTGPVVVNAGSSSFVRVSYDDEAMSRLVSAAPQLDLLERFVLIDDLWAGVVAGSTSAATFCDVAERMAATETDLAVWQNLLGGLSWCDRFLSGAGKEGFQGWAAGLLRPALDRMGLEPDPEETERDQTLRGALFQAAGNLAEDEETIARARGIEAASRAGEHIDASMATAALNVAAAHGTQGELDAFVVQARDATNPQLELRYLYALPLFRDPALLAAVLSQTLEGGWVRTQNAPSLIGMAIANKEVGSVAWEFVKTQWPQLSGRMPEPLTIRMAAGVRFLTEPGQVEDVAQFFAANPIPQGAKTLEQTLERQRIFAALRERASRDLERKFG